MNLLALDIGLKRTGVAFGETGSGIVMALDTVLHDTAEELVTKVNELVKHRKIEKLIVGLPLLLSGEKGSQAEKVLEVVEMMKKATGIPVQLIDERYTTTHQKTAYRSDSDAKSACTILSIAMDRKNSIDM